ncbi:hypothetical protein SETIT_5G057500v2 [Setaria italica]|uniref:Rx N-terminal domain-containing protein n=1 Tax=Setaria italica TaxID=4555 RepID=K3XSC2_SETIT|nr:uncharacterized protein LOC101774502 [Setaria italica]RCV24102.1 hypothetical protein SETIT_5G057500v2 [Setaria italica]
MDALASAVVSDLIGRCLSFLIARYQKHAAASKLGRLHRLLLRARAVIEEAETRHITNRGMLLQLGRLREGMYRGHYVLDASRRLAAVSTRRRVLAARRSSSSSPYFDAAAVVDGNNGEGAVEVSGDSMNELQAVVDSLEAVLGDMKEFVVFLGGYPRVGRQPYSTYLHMGRCMFGRHGEMERVIEFLLRPCSLPGVLPITGPPEVGKKTLVEHVCADDRVRKQFPLITHLCGDELGDGEYDLIPEHQEHVPSGGGSLIIVEFAGAPDASAWRRFYSSVSNSDKSSKIIVISQTEQVSTLGTGQALRLATLHKEEYWHFFKVLAFGSADPGDHPELASIAMDLVDELKGSFMAANILSRLMHSSMDARFWRRVLEVVRRGVRANYTAFGEHPSRLPGRSRLAYLCGAAEDAPLCFYYDWRKQTGTWRPGPAQSAELPKVTLQDVLDGRAVPRGEDKMGVLAWRSPIPPYYNYVTNCAVEAAAESLAVTRSSYLKRKRLR